MYHPESYSIIISYLLPYIKRYIKRSMTAGSGNIICLTAGTTLNYSINRFPMVSGGIRNQSKTETETTPQGRKIMHRNGNGKEIALLLALAL
jgi:hypothetical protein